MFVLIRDRVREADNSKKVVCKGCRRIAALLEAQRISWKSRFPPRLLAQLLHSNFAELDACCRTCTTCRIFRQSLLLKQVTTTEVASLEASPLPLRVTLPQVQHEWGLVCLNVHVGDLAGEASEVKSYKDPDGPASSSLYVSAHGPQTYQRIIRWLEECDSHIDCTNLHWSSRNPTRLVRITLDDRDSKVRLILSPQDGERVRYVALSYCWGEESMDEDEKRLCMRGKTTKANIGARLMRTFSSSKLPQTIRDAIAIAKMLSIEFIWVDSLCIVQGDAKDWAREASRMHEVYGNAYLTISSCSTSKATQSLFQERKAWKYAIESEKLSQQWLKSSSITLDEVRTRSPLSRRGWTLQEELLSPRILYWSSQMVYWSCSRKQQAENEPAQYASVPEQALSLPQGFLSASWEGNSYGSHSLHDYWQDVVESFTERYLSEAEDRFAALSGIASVYCRAQNGQQYIAGLWRDTFGKDLIWFVKRPGDKAASLETVAPSWSWASLPFGTGVSRREGTWIGTGFALLDVFVQGETLPLPKYDGMDPLTSVQEGAAVTSVKVCGKLRPFLRPESKRVLWSDISRESEGKEKFTFAEKPEQPVYSVDLKRGLVLAYESRKREIVGQLDYTQDASRVHQGTCQIQCLRVGESTMMLLLERMDCGNYRRIGISEGFREDFFFGVEREELKLF